MYDAHNDLLTNLYFNLKAKNKFQNLELLITQLQNVYQENNIQGGIINFLFTDCEEMYEKFGIKKQELTDTKKMFYESIEFLENLKYLDIIDPQTDFLYSIEGCNYINVEDLVLLKQMGLSSILPVSNDTNKYGSGYNDNENNGLTELGKELIKTVINLKIMIDVSNTNEKTFNDILDIIEEEKVRGKQIFLIASHSNAKDLCQSKRNFTKEQLERLRKNNAYVGVNLNYTLLTKKTNPTQEEKEQALIDQIDYLLNEINFEQERILISSDDMNYHPNTNYHNKQLYQLNTIKHNLTDLLNKKYGTIFTKKVIEKNPKQLMISLKPYQESLFQKII